MEQSLVFSKTHTALNDLRKLLPYLVASLVLGAALAPVLFRGSQWLAGQGIFTSLATQAFQRYFNCSVQIVAISLLMLAFVLRK